MSLIPPSIAAGSLESWEYFASYSDLRGWALLDGVLTPADSTNSAWHYNTHADAEHRSIQFDAWEYLASNVDLINWLGADGITAQDAITAAQHYILHGVNEGRTVTFDSATYLAANADLVAWLGATNYDAAAKHYIEFGRFENRPGTPASTFYLTSYDETHSAYTFISNPEYTPGGNDLVNTLQNGDRLTGLGDHATLTATLDNPNDNASYTIAPHLTNIETFSVDFRDTAYASNLDMQDSDHFLNNVNVTAVSTGGFTIKNLHAEATNLSVSDTHAVSDITFTYLNQELTGTGDTVTLTLNNVYANLLTLGTNGTTQQIEHINLISNGDPSVNLVDLNPDTNPSTSQSLHITANGDLVLGEDLSTPHTGYVPAVPTVLGYPAADKLTIAGQSSCHVFPVTGLAGHDLGIIEHDYAFTFDTVASLNLITVVGSGNVTLGSVGSAEGFVLNGSGAYGNIDVNISNAAHDPLATFTTGHGNDTVLVDQVLTGYYGTGLPLWGHDSVDGSGHLWTGEDNAVTLAGKIYTGDGSDVVLANDLDESHSNPLWRTEINTGSGADTVVVGTLLGGPGQAIVGDYNGALITLGEGNDSVTANNLQEEAQIDAGVGNDVINLTTTVDGSGFGYTVIAGDNSTLDSDGHGAEVLAGSGDDQINFLFTGTALHDLGFSVIQGYVDGGSGNDSITVCSNKNLDLVNGSSTKVGDTAITKAITGVETLTLNSSTAWDPGTGTLHRAWDFNHTTNGTRTIEGNDDNGKTADYTVNRGQFDLALKTINLNHQDGVILNIAHEIHDTFVAYGGDAAVDTLTNLVNDEQINLTALETYTNNGAGYQGSALALVTGTGAAADTLGTVYGAGDVHSVCGVMVPFTADLTVNLGLANGTGTGDIAHVAINGLGAQTSIYSDLRPATTVLNSDFSIDDAGSGGNRYEAIALTVIGNHNHGIDLNNDFLGNLTLTGSGTTAGGNLTIINIGTGGTGDGHSVVNTSAYDGNVYLGIDSSVNHTVISGSGNDIVRLGDDSVISLGNDYVDLKGGNDTVIFNGLGTGSVNHAGLSNSDTVIGGSGYDTLAIAGQDADSGIGVSISETELQTVLGFEAIQFSVGQGEPSFYHLTLANSVFAQNGVSTNNVLRPSEKVIDIVNNNLDEYNLVLDLNNSLANGSGHWTQLGNVSESDLTINLLKVGIDYQITYDGATNAEGEQGSGDHCIVAHGSNDRFIFNDGNLDGGDTINGGAHDGDGTTVLNDGALHNGGAYTQVLSDIRAFYPTHFSVSGSGLGNGDVLEIRNDAEVIAGHDLANVKNVGTIVFNNDISSSAQTLIIDLNDAVVDNMVDSLHTASTVAGGHETLVIVANDGTISQNHAAQLNLDASTLHVQSQLFIQLDDKDYGTHLGGTGSTADGGVFGFDSILGGSGDDYINGVTGRYGGGSGPGDIIDGGSGSDTIGFTTYFSNFSDNQIKNVEVIDVWHDVNHDSLAGGSDQIYVDLTLQGGSSVENFTINVHEHNGTGSGNILWGGQDNDTIHIYDNYADVHGYYGNDIITVENVANQNGESISGGLGSDSIVGGTGDDHIWAYESSGSGTGDDTITGGAGNDDIWLNAGTGNGNVDVVKTAWGGEGVDTIHNFTAGSGAGHDVFTFTGTSDIAGFSINPSLLQSGVNLNGGGGANAGVQAGFVTVLDNAATLDATGIANALSAGVNKLSTFASATHDVFYLAIDNNVDTEIVKINDLNGDGAITSNEITLIAHLVGVTDAGTLVHANFGNLP